MVSFVKTSVIVILFLFTSALILFTSTDTIALFSGSHTIVDISADENDISCTSCHSQVLDELNNSAIHSNFKCEECHRLTKTSSGETISYAVHNQSIYAGKQAHAAYTPRCLNCHGNNGVYYNDTWVAKQAPPAKAFNELNYGSDYSAHKPFVEYALTSGLSVGENEACIACHTNYSMKFEYKHFWDISYTLSDWSFSSFSYNGTREYTITFSKTGHKHEFVNTNEINCISCHKNIYDALVNGTSGTPLYLTHSPIEIAHSGGMSNWDIDNPWPPGGPTYHYRYHYIPASNRSEWVNNSYCIKCHNVNKYATEHPSDATYYNLSDVTADTNSTKVHAAEAVWCKSCHGSGKTKEVINNPDKGGWGHGASFVDDVANNYARAYNGDICMGCHEAAVHPSSGGCGRCHSSSKGNANVYIESESSGYATNT